MEPSTVSSCILTLHREFAAYTTQRLQELGLSFGLIYFVIYVGKHPDCTPSELTKALHLDWGHSQRSLNKLAEDGFLTKEKNGRSYHLKLTQRGENLCGLSSGLYRLGCAESGRTDSAGAAAAADITAKSSAKESVQMMYETILSPIHYGGMQLKNRIIFAPTTFGLSDEEYLAKIRAIAQGGCAMIIVGDVPVGKSKFEKSLFDPKGFAFYQQVVKIAHDADCKVCAQLHQSDSNLLAMFKYIPGLLLKKITPDQLREKLNAEVAPYITNMSQRKIHEIISGFGKAAALAKQAGFDMVQVHGDRMCGSFSSAIFNHRTDEYGGSAENRARFAAEAVSAVHAAVPGMPIDYKLAVRQENPHFGNAGVVEEELPVFVPLLEQAGVTSFHVTLANHSALENTIPPADHPYFSQPGCFLKFCDEVRQYTELPICGVGGLNDPDLVEQQLASGRIQCAAMSRQLLADPDWVNKLKNGQAEQIHRCLRCNKKCLGGLMAHQGTRCVYDALREKEAKNA